MMGIGTDCEILHEETVERVKQKLPDDALFFNLADLYKIFGDSTRVRILWALDIEEMCVCDLAVLLNLTKSAVSHQLRILRHANLVKPRRAGKEVFYSLADEHVKEIFEKGMDHIQEG
jgi:ArsR family transcriptional regulator